MLIHLLKLALDPTWLSKTLAQSIGIFMVSLQLYHPNGDITLKLTVAECLLAAVTSCSI